MPSRRLEFAVGRACARAALSALGFPVTEIPRLDDRSPRWPPGVTGSISHTQRYAVAVAAVAELHRIGIDVESWGRIGDDVIGAVSTSGERVLLADATQLDEGDAATVVFAAKEAFYKAQYAWTATFVEFDDVRIAEVSPDQQAGPSLRSFRLLVEPTRHRLAGLAWPVEVTSLLFEDRVAATAVVELGR